MKLSEFDFSLPENLIATHPEEIRDSAQMLYLDKESGQLKDSRFFALSTFLKKGDVLVLNESKVIPARLFGASNGRKFEVLLVKEEKNGFWESWVKPGKKANIGDKFIFSEKLNAQLVSRKDEIFYFDFNLKGDDFYKELEEVGEMPIPPYILKARHEKDAEAIDNEDYQTVFAKEKGSVAAPTAGLHFTRELLHVLEEVDGIQIEKVTLHVGLGTFQPVKTENVEDFKIHSEKFEISKETVERLNKAKEEGRRIIAVGTTSVRVLESVADEKGRLVPKSGETSIYIYPGYEFKFVDGMITNFHLPKSSLLLLVSAFAGNENIKKAYQHAIEKEYRFYSYGDGMLIL